MSKINAIQDLLSQGTNLNDEAGDYLVWFMESIETEHRFLSEAKTAPTEIASKLSSIASSLAKLRAAVDKGESTRTDYEKAVAPLVSSIASYFTDAKFKIG